MTPRARSAAKNRARPFATHPITLGNHSPDLRLAMVAIAGPVTRSEHMIGDVLQARSGIAGVDGVQA